MAAPRYPDLDTFLTALRFEGFAVGPHEIVRLQHVFHQGPELDQQALQALLACTLVKHQDQRSRFDALFDDWYHLATDAMQPPIPGMAIPPVETPPADQPISPPPQYVTPLERPLPITEEIAVVRHTPPTPEVQQPSPWRLWALAGLMILSVIMGYGPWLRSPQDKPGDPTTPGPTVSEEPRPAEALPSEPAAEHWTWVPEFKVPPAPLVDPATLALGLALLSLSSGLFLFWRYSQRHDIPDFEPAPVPGPQ